MLYGFFMREDECPEVPVGEDGDERIVDIPTAQRLLGRISRREVTNMVRRGELKKIKIGRRAVITIDSINARIDRAIDESQAVPA